MRRRLTTELRIVAAGVALLLAMTLAWGARPVDRVADRNNALLQVPVATLAPGLTACQPDAIPSDAGRVRVPAVVQAGALRSRIVVVAGTTRVAGAWAPSSRSALIMPRPARHPSGATEICVESQGPGTAVLEGQPTGETDRLRLGDGTGAGRMRIDYLYGDGARPLWGKTLLALPGRIAAATGSVWAPWLVGVALLLTAGALAALLAGRRELLAVAVLAFGSAATWSGITPLFQASDELSHAAYVQVFGELGHPPRDRRNTGKVPEELACWALFARLNEARFFEPERPPWTLPRRDPCAGTERKRDAAQYQAIQPPAYYALATAAYEVGSALGRPLPERLLLARLISALLAAMTVVSAFLLVREAFPRSPWPARAGALAAGLQPVMMFNHGTINSDALVFATAAGAAAVLARIWRRGPTPGRGLLLGALLGIGAIAKITFLLVIPIALAALVVILLMHRQAPLTRRALLLGATLAMTAAPPLLYALLGDAIIEPSVQSEDEFALGIAGSRQLVASYVWQSMLPPLPFMEDLFPNAPPPGWHAMITGPVSRLGWWDDYGIAAPFSDLLVVAAAVLVLWALVAAGRRRDWRPALAIAAAVAVAYSVMLVAVLYTPNGFQVQGRYMGVLIPLWALAAGTVVASLRPSRQGPAAALLAVAMLGWTALALEATLSRWYL